MEAAFRRAFLRHHTKPTAAVGGNARALQEFCTINFNEGDSHIRLLYDRPKIRSGGGGGGSYATLQASKQTGIERPPLSNSPTLIVPDPGAAATWKNFCDTTTHVPFSSH